MTMEDPPDSSWLRFERSTTWGMGADYSVDTHGYYHCKACDLLLVHKARYCDIHRPRRSLRQLRVVC